MKATGALVVLVLVLAGCTSPPADDPTLDPSLRAPEEREGMAEPLEPTGAPPSRTAPPRPVEEPPVGLGETDATRWVRERWGGATELSLMDLNVTLEPHPEVPAFAYCFPDCLYALAVPPVGNLVLPGAASIEVNLTFAGSGSISVGYTDDGEYQYKSVYSGKPFNITVGNRTDLPFEGYSSFSLFLVEYDFSSLTGANSFEVHVTAVVRRGPTLPTFGPTPDPWEGAKRIALVNASTHTQLVLTAPLLFGCLYCDYFWSVLPGAVVPPGSDAIHVDFSWDSLVPLAEPPRLYYWSGGHGGRLEPSEAGARSFRYDLEVPPEETDSPFRNESRWFFYIDIPDLAGTGYQAWQGSVTLSAEVTRP